jgi:hypothetical protein
MSEALKLYKIYQKKPEILEKKLKNIFKNPQLRVEKIELL